MLLTYLSTKIQAFIMKADGYGQDETSAKFLTSGWILTHLNPLLNLRRFSTFNLPRWSKVILVSTLYFFFFDVMFAQLDWKDKEIVRF